MSRKPSLESKNSSVDQVVPSDNCTNTNITNFTIPLLKLPFPPKIKASDITSKRKISEINLRPPNAFIIYRKDFLNHLSTSKHGSLKMTEASKLVSIHWNNEPDNVKEAYKQISKQVEDELNEKKRLNEKLLENRVVWKNSKRSKKNKQMNGYGMSPGGKKRSRENTKGCAVNVAKRNVVYEFVPITPEAIMNTSVKNSKCERNHKTQSSITCSNEFATPIANNPTSCTFDAINTSQIITPETPGGLLFCENFQLFHEFVQQPLDPLYFQNLYYRQDDSSDFEGENIDLTYYLNL
ncbi:2303_t:CDS:1 [Acaulospora morrowiae]|uniref:2303_t:CDS:1 n=1 Tax=Acaulospora morrowiae TaxID=94023 RepID=A0A9N9I0U5_9GLOM|nr:2303_t:CDS:1 [Acaulospora morrowiae]